MSDEKKLIHTEMDLFMMQTTEEKDTYCMERYGMTFAEKCKDWDENPEYRIPIPERVKNRGGKVYKC